MTQLELFPTVRVRVHNIVGDGSSLGTLVRCNGLYHYVDLDGPEGIRMELYDFEYQIINEEEN